MDWLLHSPHLRSDGSFASRATAEGILLAIGLILRDLQAGQFSLRDPDDDEFAPSLPVYVSQSGISFSLVEDQLLPYCNSFLEDLHNPPPPMEPAPPIGKGKGKGQANKRVGFAATADKLPPKEPSMDPPVPRTAKPLPRPRRKRQAAPSATAAAEIEQPQSEPASPSKKRRPSKRVKLTSEHEDQPDTESISQVDALDRANRGNNAVDQRPAVQPLRRGASIRPKTRSQTQGQGSRSRT